MTLLLDENISWRICRLLEHQFLGVAHVTDTTLGETSTDAVIWEYARNHGHCIVTNDDDFHSMASVKGFPPKVILLRMGNQSTRNMAEVMLKHFEDIEQFIASEDLGVLEIL